MENDLFEMSKKMLKLEEELESFHKNVADSLDVLNPVLETNYKTELEPKTPTAMRSFKFDESKKGSLKQSKSWNTLEKKLEINFSNLQTIQNENKRLQNQNTDLEQTSLHNFNKIGMLEKEIEVLTKERGFYEKLYVSRSNDYKLVKEKHAKEITALKDEYNKSLKTQSLMKDSYFEANSRVRDTGYNSSLYNQIIDDRSTSQKELYGSHVQQKLHEKINELKSALTIATEQNKALKHKMTYLEKMDTSKSKFVVGISGSMTIFSLSKVSLVNTGVQTLDNMIGYAKELEEYEDTVNTLNNKIESLIHREIELQMTINDLEFKLRCHKKFINDQASK